MVLSYSGPGSSLNTGVIQHSSQGSTLLFYIHRTTRRKVIAFFEKFLRINCDKRNGYALFKRGFAEFKISSK